MLLLLMASGVSGPMSNNDLSKPLPLWRDAKAQERLRRERELLEGKKPRSWPLWRKVALVLTILSLLATFAGIAWIASLFV